MRITPASSGWKWLARGWTLFRRRPAEWMLLAMAFLLFSTAVNWIAVIAVPLAGPFLPTLLVPALFAGLMHACAATEAGEQPSPLHLLIPLRRSPKPMLAMGLLYLLANLAALNASSLVDEGTLMRQVVFGTTPAETALADGSYLKALLVAAALATPLVMALWFAPMLVHWERLGALKAMFYSFFASLRNWKAMSLYTAALFAGLTAASLIVVMVALATGLGITAMRGALIGIVLALMPAIICSFYCSYRDIFPHEMPVIESDPAS